MNSFAEQIKQAVTMRQVCEMYGLEVNRAGFCKCPFHNERTASMKVYDGNRGYFCFGCHRSGDVIGFVKDYFSLTFKDALVKLNTDFNLHFQLDEKPSKEAVEAANNRKRSQIATKTAHKRLVERYNAALDKFTELDKKRVVGELNAKQGIITDDFAEALREIETAKYELDEAETRLWEYENRSANNS